MVDLQVPSPARLRLMPAMKDLLREELERRPAVTAYHHFSLIASEIGDGNLQGHAPKKSQVGHLLRRWRGLHPGPDTQQAVEFLDGALYDELGLHESDSGHIVYFSGAVRHRGRWVSRVRVGTEEDPYRVGMTCYRLLYNYLQVERDSYKTTLIRIDIPFNTVAQKHPAFVIGYSDTCGHFIPLGYFCTSPRKKGDVAWCLRYLKRTTRETFNESFDPQFVMMDGDKAQHNTCESETPSARVLTYWYHIMDNVFKQMQIKGVDLSARAQFFGDLYDFHYSPRNSFEVLETSIPAKWSSFPKRSPTYAMDKYIKSAWMNNRFCDRQGISTPTSYAVTNNPLEQYHRVYNIINNNPRASPKEMLQGMKTSLLSFLAEGRVFEDGPEASQRLLKPFALPKPHRRLNPARVPVETLPVVLFKVHQSLLPVDEVDVLEKVKTVCSVNDLRIHMKGMSEHGWAIDAQTLSYSCLYDAKHGMCLHVLAVGFEAGVRILGAALAPRRFVPNLQRPRRFSWSNRGPQRQHRRSRQRETNNELMCDVTDEENTSSFRLGGDINAPNVDTVRSDHGEDQGTLVCQIHLAPTSCLDPVPSLQALLNQVDGSPSSPFCAARNRLSGASTEAPTLNQINEFEARLVKGRARTGNAAEQKK